MIAHLITTFSFHDAPVGKFLPHLPTQTASVLAPLLPCTTTSYQPPGTKTVYSLDDIITHGTTVISSFLSTTAADLPSLLDVSQLCRTLYISVPVPMQRRTTTSADLPLAFGVISHMFTLLYSITPPSSEKTSPDPDRSHHKHNTMSGECTTPSFPP